MAKPRIHWLEGVSSNEIERALATQRYAWLRPQRMRRILVVVNLVALGLLYSSPLWLPISEGWATLRGLVSVGALFALSGLTYTALRMSIRKLVDAPDMYLDERQVRRRDSHHTRAYRLLPYATLLMMLVWIASPPLSVFATEGEVDGIGLWLGFLMAVAGLPAMVAAWSEREV